MWRRNVEKEKLDLKFIWFHSSKDFVCGMIFFFKLYLFNIDGELCDASCLFWMSENKTKCSSLRIGVDWVAVK